MFGLFKKKILKTEEEKRAESLPRTKKVQFEPMKVAEAEQLLEADIRAVQGKFNKFPNRDAKFLHGALLSDKKRQTAASPSAARTVRFSPFALFPHSEHCPRRDFAPAGASRGQ
mgnify:CR=1 FL=1